MSKALQHSFGPWLSACLPDLTQLAAAARLATAASTPQEGDGSLLVFSMARACLDLPDGPAAAWVDLAEVVAKRGLVASAKHSQILEGTRRDRRAKVWGPMLRMADLHAQQKLAPGCRVAIGLVLSQGLISGTALSKKVADQLSGMAGACVRGSGHEYADEWVAFSQLDLLNVDELQAVVDSGAPEQIRALAATLRRAVEGLAALPKPADIREGLPSGTAAAGSGIEAPNELPEKTTAAPEQAHASEGGEQSSRGPHKQVATVVGLSKDASFARTAHVFGVPDTWDRYSPHRLSAVTRAVAEALAPRRLGVTRGLAVLTLMSMVVSHDHRPAARLRIGLREGETPDLWYSPADRCVYANRRLLLRLKTDDGTPDLIPLFVPVDLADEVDARLLEQPDARELFELFGIQDLDAWLHQAEVWLSGLGDPAHKSRSARISHALGLVYRLVGASEAEAALLTLNLSLAADGTLNYLQISGERAYELACLAFDFLGLQRPAKPIAGMRIGSRDVPTIDEMRADWVGIDESARSGLSALRVADNTEAALSAFTQVMVAARRAFESLTGSRHENMGMPRVVDLIGSEQEGYTDDKRTAPSSARLLTITPELRHVVAFVGEARGVLLERLKWLGIPESQIPLALKEWLPWSPFFLTIKAVGKGRKRSLKARVLNDKDFNKHQRPWTRAANMGRHFWVSAASDSGVAWAVRLICGHGRGLAFIGSTCLGTPVAVLQRDAALLVRRTLDVLALPAFGGGASPLVQQLPPMIDLRFLDARNPGASIVCSAPGDMPQHHCDSHSTMALPLARTWQAHVGTNHHLPHGATVLLSLAAIDGLTFSPDILSVWEQLRSLQGVSGPAYIQIRRASGQSFELPLMPATRIALDLAGPLPDWEVAEQALLAWLAERWPLVQWPTRRGAALTAVCWITARLVRLVQIPILLHAYRPEVNAACFDAVSNARLKTGGAPCALAGAELKQVLRPLTRRVRSTGRTLLQQMLRQHGLVSMSKQRRGGPERRAKVLHAWFKHRFPEALLTPVALMILCWVLAECMQWDPLLPSRDQPSTIYKYLQRLLAALEGLPENTDPALFGPDEWRMFGVAMLDTSDVILESDRAKAFRWRRVALGRMVAVLQKLPQYALARHAVRGQDAPDGSVPRAVSAARVMVRPIDLETSVSALQLVYNDNTVQALSAEARLRLAFDLRARADEINALEISDLAEDGSFIAIDTVGFTYRKTRLSMRFGQLSPPTAAAILKLREALRSMGKPPKLFFSDADGDEDLRHGYRQQVVVDTVVRSVLQHPGFEPHALRGNGFQDGLCPGHTDHIIAMLAGPLELVHARAIVQGLAGSSPAHVAAQLNTTGHASHGVAVADYMTAWPWWYAAGMRVALATVRLDPALAAGVPGCSANALATWRLRGARRGLVDEWSWVVRRHYPGWKWRPPPSSAAGIEPPGPAPLPQPTTKENPLGQVPFRRQVHYLLLRQLGWKDIGACKDAGLADSAGQALEPLVLLLPSFAEVHDPTNHDPPDRARGSAVRALEEPVGEQLFNHLLAAQSVGRRLLRLMLVGGAPPFTKPRVLEALQALPTGLGLELAVMRGEEHATLKQVFAEVPRVQVVGLSRPPKSTPRVRVVHVAPSQINHCSAAWFTALARLILESIHQLNQGKI